MNPKVVHIFFDGACHNQAGQSSPMGMGIAIYFDSEYQEDLSLAIFNDGSQVRGTNNIAEWIGCVEAMKAAAGIRKTLQYVEIKVYSDSMIIANCFNKTFQIREKSFQPFFDEAHKWAAIAKIGFVTWIPREHNKQADELSKKGLHGNNPYSKHFNKYKDSEDTRIAISPVRL